MEIGVNFSGEWNKLTVHGVGLNGFYEPGDVLDAGNSGTTARLMMGMLSGQPFLSIITGDDSLKKRPMGRISDPLQQMGVSIDGRNNGMNLPLSLHGPVLRSLDYALPVASAQLKSALLLASLYANGESKLGGKINSRDHTERMLKTFGSKILCKWGRILLPGRQVLKGKDIKVPGDFSAASFFLVAGVLAQKADIFLEGVGINPGRTGLLEILSKMGAKIEISNRREYGHEPVADLYVAGPSTLKGVVIGEEMVPRLVDEIPILVVAALFARGQTVIKGAGELRLKESDRLHALSVELGKMGASIKEFPDGLIIEGNGDITGSRCHSHGDHRIAMSLAIAALFAYGETIIEDPECAYISYPKFYKTLAELQQ